MARPDIVASGRKQLVGLLTDDPNVVLEEGAQIQLLADALGGSRPYGPGVLTQQWKMSGLYERATELGLVPGIDRRS